MRAIAALFLPFLAIAASPARADEPAWLGVKLGPIPEALAAHLKDARGAMVEEVVPGSPAEAAGLKRFDMIVGIDGTALQAPDEIRARVRSGKKGDALKLDVIRGNEKVPVAVTLGEMPAELPPLGQEREKAPEKPRRPFLGIGTGPVPPVVAYHLKLDEGVGVIVGDVVPGSPAEAAGIASNDVIVAVSGKAVESPEEFVRSLAGKKPGDEVSMEVLHKGEKKAITAKLGEWPEGPDALLPMPHDPMGPRFWGVDPREPRNLRRGRIILRGPDGKEHDFQLPDSFWKAEDVFKDLEKRFGEMRENVPELKDHLEKTLKDIQRRFKDGGPSGWSSSSASSSSVIRSNDGAYDITIREQDGVRTVTVEKDGKPVAQDLPWEKLDTLPADVREKVEGVSKSLKVETRGKPELPPIEKDEGKIKA